MISGTTSHQEDKVGDIKTSEQKILLSEKLKNNNPMHDIKNDPIRFEQWRIAVSLGTIKGQTNSIKYQDRLQKLRSGEIVVPYRRTEKRLTSSANNLKNYHKNAPPGYRSGKNNPMFR